MAVLLPIICFACIFLCVSVNNIEAGTRPILLRCILLFSVLLALMTEVAGYFYLISYRSLFICWSAVNLVLICYLYFKKAKVLLLIGNIKQRISYIINRLRLFEKMMLGAVMVLLGLIFIQGIVYPPNNRDSLSYHMARIPSWISHHSVDAFPTHVVRQVYQPPFAEYVIMHINLLNHSDYFSACVQLFFFIFCAIAISSIIKHFGMGHSYQIIGFLLALTLPEGVLQASSTQNDIVLAFFVITAFYFCIRSLHNASFKNYLLLGLASGLAIFTKGTAYMYLAPVLGTFGIAVIIQLFRFKKLKYLLYAFFCVFVLPVSINSFQYYRNFSFSGNLLGIDKNEAKLYGNEQMNPKLFICNSLKNADLQMGLLCVPRITYAGGKLVHKVFDVTGVNLNDPAITYPGVRGLPGDAIYYMGRLVATHEDFAPNFMHFLLLNFSLLFITIYLFKKNWNGPILLLALTVILQIVLFCGYLKWQTIGTRLQTEIFLISIPLAMYVCSINVFFKKMTTWFAVPFCIIYAFFVVLFNFTRPFITHYQVVHAYTPTAPTSIFFDRYKKMFSAIEATRESEQYQVICNDMRSNKYKNIGLIMRYNDWEYPLFTDCYTRELNPVPIFVTNYTRNIRDYNSMVDCIVSTTLNKPYIDYMGKRFYNQTYEERSLIYYYKQL